MTKVFISYRRMRGGGAAARLKQRLERHFGNNSVFLDSDIPLGEDAQRRIMEEIDACEGFLVIMPPDWKDLAGHNDWTLQDPEDYVRQEIEAAQARDCLTIPVFIEGGAMPRKVETRDLDFMTRFHNCNGIKLPDPLDEFEEAAKKIISRIEQHAKNHECGRRALDQFKALWDAGDWIGARDHLVEVLKEVQALKNDQVELTSPYRVLRAKQDVAKRLAEMSSLLEQREFDNIPEVAQHIERVEAPAAFGKVLELVELARKAAAVSGSWERLQELQADLDRLAGDLPPQAPGCSQVGVYLRELNEHWQWRYQEARTRYEEGRFTAALEIFSTIEGLDVESFRRRGEVCIRILDQGRQRDWVGVFASLSDLEAQGEGELAREWRRWCRRAERCIPVLEEMAADDFVSAPDLPREGDGCPYRALGIRPAELMKTIQDNYEAARDPERKWAWNTLRRVEGRLRADFSLYRVSDRERVREAIRRFFSFDEGTLPGVGGDAGRFWASLREALGEGLGVFHALQRDYAAAIAVFRQQLGIAPHDPWALHHLSLAAAASLVTGGEACDEQPWDALIMGLGASLADERFWHSWWARRRAVYDIDGEQVEELRLAIQQEWMDRVQEWARPGDDPRTELRVEVQGARALNAGKGIIDGRHIIVLGRLGVRRLGLTEVAARWTGSFGSACLDQEGWKRRACLYLSQMAEALSLFEEGQFALAVEHCDALQCPAGSRFVELNPGLAGFGDGATWWHRSRDDLRARGHQRCGLQALSAVPPDIMEALDHWTQGVAAARRLRQEDAFTEAVATLVKGRAKALKQTLPDDKHMRLKVLDDTVEMLWAVVDRGWPALATLVEEDLVDALLDRAVHLSNAFDREEEARADARRAWGLRPHNLRAIQNLCWASLHFAAQLQHGSERDRSEALAEEIQVYLDRYQPDYPNDPVLDRARMAVTTLRQQLDAPFAAPEEALKEMLQEVQPSRGDSREARLSDAAVLESRSEFAAAMKIYEKLAAESPDDMAEVRGRMAWCYRNWIAHQMAASVPPNEMRELIRTALACCPEARALQDLPREFSSELPEDDA